MAEEPKATRTDDSVLPPGSQEETGPACVDGEHDDPVEEEDAEEDEDGEEEGGARARRGKRGADELADEQKPEAGSEIFKDPKACACQACNFIKHRNPPSHFAEVDHAFCCSLCRLSRGRKHGGHCERAHQKTGFGMDPAATATSTSAAEAKPLTEGPKAQPSLLEGIDPSLPWSERKRLMVLAAGGKLGDQTVNAPTLEVGFDPWAEEERSKAAARLARFGDTMAHKASQAEEAAAAAAALVKRSAKFGLPVDAPKHAKALKTLKALRLTPQQVFAPDPRRVDPPPPPAHSGAPGTAEKAEAVSPASSGLPSSASSSPSSSSSSSWPSAKLHLFCLGVDRDAFKQMRSPDLVAYLKNFQPTYVEWLGDRSCNVHFADAFAAKRALNAFFKDLPPPPPPAPAAAVAPTEAAQGEGGDPEEAAAGTDGGDDQAKAAAVAAAATAGAAESFPDLAAMGWRVGPPLTKAKADRFGRKGVSCRLLCRPAHAAVDVLVEKPPPRPQPNGHGGDAAAALVAQRRRQAQQPRGRGASAGAVGLDAPLPSTRQAAAAADPPAAAVGKRRREVDAAAAAAVVVEAGKRAKGEAKGDQGKGKSKAELVSRRGEVNATLSRLVMNPDGSFSRRKEAATADDDATPSTVAAAAAAAPDTGHPSSENAAAPGTETLPSTSEAVAVSEVPTSSETGEGPSSDFSNPEAA